MAFVSSPWYIVMAILIVAIVALVVVFILMDKKDKAIIEEFIQSSNAEAANQESVEAAATETSEQVKE